MKTNTALALAEHIKMGNIYFPEDKYNIEITLTKSQMRALIINEYGIRSKKSRIIKKHVKRLLNQLLGDVLKEFYEDRKI